MGAQILSGGTLSSAGIEGHSRAQYGRISYSDGMARMTNSYNSGAVQAMHRASGGNYGDFSAMAQRVVKTPGLMGGLTDTGATPQMISALYHMGGQ